MHVLHLTSRQLLEEKWNAFARTVFVVQLIIFVAITVIATSAVASGNTNPSDYTGHWGELSMDLCILCNYYKYILYLLYICIY